MEENKPIKLTIAEGPFGDSTYLYKVDILAKNFTVRNLIDYALKTKSDEWGYINIGEYPNVKYSMEYRLGKIVSDNIPETIKNQVIRRCTADGGWTRMDYTVRI